MTRRQRFVAAFEVFTLYLIAGATCQVVSTSMPQLVRHFGAPLVSVAAISSAFSFGRLSTVLLMGWLTEKIGPKRVIAIGTVLILCFLFGLVVAPVIGVAIALGTLGGIGMGTQDAAGPVILLRAFPERYASSMGVAQCFFGAGCFIPSVVMSLCLSAGKPYYLMNYILAVLCVPLLLLMPFLKWTDVPSKKVQKQQVKGKKRPPFAWVFLALIIVFYCGTVSSVGIYCVSYAVFRGIPESSAVSILSFYNAGGMIGTMFFAWVLRRISPSKVLYLNFGGALIAIVCTLFATRFWTLALGYFFVGAATNIIFNIIVTLAVQNSPEKAGQASAMVATLSSGVDTLMPLLTGALATAFSLRITLWFGALSATFALLAVYLYRKFVEQNRQSSTQ